MLTNPYYAFSARVTTKPGFAHLVTESSVITLVASRLPRHCIPVLVVVSEETMPRNAVGKHLKREIREDLTRLWDKRGRVAAKWEKAKL